MLVREHRAEDGNTKCINLFSKMKRKMGRDCTKKMGGFGEEAMAE